MIIVYCKKEEKYNTGRTFQTITYMNIITECSNLHQLSKQTGSSVKASDMYLGDAWLNLGWNTHTD
jgi:hypothetical protein